jgi:hypothetical protein
MRQQEKVFSNLPAERLEELKKDFRCIAESQSPHVSRVSKLKELRLKLETAPVEEKATYIKKRDLELRKNK